MLCNKFNITYNCISLLILIFLAKAKAQIEGKKHFNWIIQEVYNERVSVKFFWLPKCCVVRLTKSIIDTRKQHDNIKIAFPRTINRNDQLAEVIYILLHREPFIVGFVQAVEDAIKLVLIIFHWSHSHSALGERLIRCHSYSREEQFLLMVEHIHSI